MAHESFEDVEVAKLLNEYFICVKVDREERPDVDSVYMSVCQAVTGSGGWPLTIIMDADQRPFFAGTYIPKRSKFGVVGLMELLPAIWERWTHNRNGLTSIGDQICAYLNQERTKTGGNGNEDPIMFVKSAYRQLNSMFDEKTAVSAWRRSSQRPISCYSSSNIISLKMTAARLRWPLKRLSRCTAEAYLTI